MEHAFKVGDLVMRKTGIELWMVCDIQDDGEQIVCQSTFDGRKHAFFWKGLKLAPEIPTASKFKVGDIVVQTGTCQFYTVAKLLDDACVEMMPNEHGFARRFHESALELAPPIGDAYIPHIPKTMFKVGARNWGKSRTLEDIRKSMESNIGYPGVSYSTNLEHTYVPNEDALKYIKDDMELTMKMHKTITTNPVTHEFICDELYETYQKKNADYGNSFENSLDKHGLIAAIVRMDDKMNRVTTLNKTAEQLVNDESVRDTLMDLANYVIMSVMWLDNKSGEESDGGYLSPTVYGAVDLTDKGSFSLPIGVCTVHTPEEWEKLRSDIKSGAEEFDSDLLAPGAGIIGASDRDIYADNQKLDIDKALREGAHPQAIRDFLGGADYDGDTTNS